MPKRTKVVACVCTYRRQHLLENLLNSLATQQFTVLPPADISIVIVDNECSEKTRRICNELAPALPVTIRYLEEDRKGISYARNTALDNVPDDTEFIAMIDDDEIPLSNWLEALLIAQQQSGADVVSGPVQPVFTGNVHTWIVNGGFFEYPRDRLTAMTVHLDQMRVINGTSTNNSLVAAGVIRKYGVRFDESFALRGGEDKLFFRRLRSLGCRFVWTNKAVVKEFVPQERSNFSYLWRSAYREGNIRLDLWKAKKTFKGKGAFSGKLLLKVVGAGAGEIARAIVQLLAALPSCRKREEQIFASLLRVGVGLGLLSSLFGYRYEQYRS